MLVVNTASKCGLTPQYEGLQQLYDDYADQGLVVLGFPCDQFGHQEPGTEEEIGAFCQQNYGVSFPMFAKIDVNGDDTHPLYRWLKDEKSGRLGANDQVELHQVPDRPRRPRADERFALDHRAGEAPPGDRGGALAPVGRSGEAAAG